MKNVSFATIAATIALLAGCQNDGSDSQIVSQRYIHKYGYAVSEEEGNADNFAGQVIKTLDNGVTISQTYENGVLQGPTTKTFPHSQTIESYAMYNQGNRVKEITYDIKGMPVKEVAQLSPSRYSITLWYSNGSPLSVEEYARDELLDGEYFTKTNEAESRVEKGNGTRVVRSRDGQLLAKESFERGFLVAKETYYANGNPESMSYFRDGKLYGEKKTFTENGEPLAIEEFVRGKLHGKSTYFENGQKVNEVTYLYGERNGLEVHFIDDDLVSQEVYWENDKRHGPSSFYIDGAAYTDWYYEGKKVSEKKFQELSMLDNTMEREAPTSSNRTPL